MTAACRAAAGEVVLDPEEEWIRALAPKDRPTPTVAGGVVGKPWLTILWDYSRKLIYSTPASMQPGREDPRRVIDPAALEAWIANLDTDKPFTLPDKWDGVGLPPRVKGVLVGVTCESYVSVISKGAVVTKLPCKKKTCHACGPRNAAATRATTLAYIQHRVEDLGWTCAVLAAPKGGDLPAWDRGLHRWAKEGGGSREYLSVTPRPGLTTTILLYAQEPDRPGYGKRQASPLAKAVTDDSIKGADWLTPCSAIFEHFDSDAWGSKPGSIIAGMQHIRSAVTANTYRLLGARQEDAECREGMENTASKNIVSRKPISFVAEQAAEILQVPGVYEAEVFIVANSGISTGRLTVFPPELRSQKAAVLAEINSKAAREGGPWAAMHDAEEALRSVSMLEHLREKVPSVGRRQRSDDSVLDEINGKTKRKKVKGRKKAPSAPEAPEVDLMDVLADT